MKLPADAFIAENKLTRYLLVPRDYDDKSNFLALAGFSLADWPRLESDLRQQILVEEAIFEEVDEYGERYRIAGTLVGPNGISLQVVTIWMLDKRSGRVRFITLFPDKNARP